MRRVQALDLDLVLEFKYLSLKELGLSGEQVRAATRQDLAQRSAVAARLNEAETQARDYGATLMQRHGLKTLHTFAVAALGVERLVWRAVVIARG